MDSSVSRPVILFDGNCALCNRSVQLVLKHERAPLHDFVALQSKTAAALLAKHGVVLPAESEALDTVYLLDSDGLHQHSSAALRVAATLRWPWRLAAIFLWLPAPLRNHIYRFIGRHRYRWFGQVEYCVALQNIDPDRLL